MRNKPYTTAGTGIVYTGCRYLSFAKNISNHFLPAVKAKKFLTLLFLLALVFAFIDADAQHQRRGLRHKRGRGTVWVSPIVGGNYTIVMGDFATLYDWKPGFHAGLLANIGYRSRVLLEPGLMYSLKGAQSSFNSDVKLNLSYAEIITNVKIKVGYYDRVFFLAGPYTGFLVAANAVAGSEKADVVDQMSRFDFGINAGGGVQLKKGFAACLHYQYGLMNINTNVPGRPVTPKNTNSAAMLSLMYFFKPN